MKMLSEGLAMKLTKLGKYIELLDKSLMKRQMLFYGVIHLYNDGLEEFMNR